MSRSRDPHDVQEALGLSDRAIARIHAIGTPGRAVELPADREAAELLGEFGALPEDLAECLSARPDQDRDADLWWILTTVVDELIRTMDTPIPVDGFRGWPALPATTGPVGRYLYVWAMLAVVPQVYEVHRRRGVEPAVTIETLSALGGVMQTHRAVTGHGGVGLFPLWGPPLRFRGTDYALGRHDFSRATLALGDGPAGHVLMVHVPPIGPLDAEASAASMSRAEEFFPRCYPEEPVSLFSCTSWLLDPQLAEYLPDTSNIIRFQQRFTLTARAGRDDADGGDRDLMRMALDMTPPDGPITAAVLDSIPQRTSLQRAYVQHLRAGSHWHGRTGWAPLTPAMPPSSHSLSPPM